MQRFSTLAVFTVTAILLSGCGMTLHPRFGPGETEVGQLPGGPTIGGPRSFPTPPARTRPDENALIRRICRSASVPRGWIAIQYVAGAEECPRTRDGGNRYTAVVIRRYANEPRGTTLTVCADQRLPRGWVRENDSQVERGCPGARVSEGAPTSYIMRRAR